MITISDLAEQYIASLLSKQSKGTNIRIFINSPGTMYAECGMSYCDYQDIDTTKDKKISYVKFKIYFRKYLKPFLKNSKIDLIKNNLNSQITLNAPNAKLLKKSKKFSQLECKIKNFLYTHINPKLSLHGGSVTLIKVNKLGVVFLKFLGGCNGCSMINTTVQVGIEKELIKYFPEISRIEDVTNHISGQHSYY
ncbi:Fe/S biogenesis protein NfuA [Buchnera aphidicola (Cinara kochiana kochiana)]|uniref:Fe/S biogenesis protein NfuA n=1 Tax=Buchnera aphidicola (Cinara kochiana kochiana) TaxID=2518976 RepID=A0A451D5X8_9GAMM|nr:NfuA family Fe-S biogenesis protein [Buchnera aphidicola]VFP81261.1 Fe/S biogenesis protein NfuA [Buchnera aphidicola (Cinara kochiana kochiana)]